MRTRILYALGAALVVVVGLATMPSQQAKPSEHYEAAAVAPAPAAMPYVGQAKVHAALAAIPLTPRPAIVCGTGTCGNVRNIGTDWKQTLIIGGQYVKGGQTSRQVGVYDANSIQTIGTYTGLDIWKLVNGRWQGQGCYFVGASALPIGNADYAARSKQSCNLG